MVNKSIFIGKRIFEGINAWIIISFIFLGISLGPIFGVMSVIATIILGLRTCKDVLKFVKENRSNDAILGKYTSIIGIVIAILTAVILFYLFGSLF